MFDVGFWEVVLTGLVALMVLGPEKLPRLVREVSFWLRKAKNVMASAKSEIDQELRLYELRQSYEEKRKSFEREVDALGITPEKKNERNVVDSPLEGNESTHERK
jgi:Tat protein translocase TatB subunit